MNSESMSVPRNFSISPGNRLSTGEQRPPLMSRRCLRRPLSRDPDAVIVGAVHRCSNAPPGVIENLPDSCVTPGAAQDGATHQGKDGREGMLPPVTAPRIRNCSKKGKQAARTKCLHATPP